MPTTEQTMLSILAGQLNGWMPSDLADAVHRNASLAQEIQQYRGNELRMWRGLASSYRLLNRGSYDKALRDINYHTVLRKVREVNPKLASAVETTHGADVWLLEQIRSVKALILT